MTDHQEAHWHLSLRRSHAFTFVASDELVHHSIQSQAVFGEYASQTAMPSYYDSTKAAPEGVTSSLDENVAKLCKTRHKEDAMLICDKARLDLGVPIDITAKAHTEQYILGTMNFC